MNAESDFVKYVYFGIAALVSCTVGIGFRIFTKLSAKVKEVSDESKITS